MNPLLRSAMIPMNTLCFQRNFAACSRALVPVQLPSRSETHLWYVVPDEVKSASLLGQYSKILSPCEKEYISCVRGERLKKTALLARVLVRTTIARYQTNGQVDPSSLKFRKNIHGKPELEWDENDHGSPPPIHFNISHTASLIACGVTVNSPIGIDLEEKDRKIKNNIVSFARRYFTAHEVEMLSSIPDPETQRQHFIKLWTLKEAYVKALGKGFSALPFSTFTIRSRNSSRNCQSRDLSDSSSSDAEIVVESVDGSSSLMNSWQFTLLELAGTHFAAICVESDGSIGGRVFTPRKVTARKTIPFVEDEFHPGTDAVVLGGL
ncbi:uncharacterized protein LOC116209687 isoform X1 [Punica granatum]|uniref:Uncharacterized protein LOC116209687 isoform X1 n=2 Tax=Punica granatum TaxID=22663 RepID=A0A6P8E307_PUNGR|nr:uncharacterized protein LOC116209687 isoform X1 [Punica granatum]PKI38511.1 hypothetical protein CRG98_041076 [Punica granatum]